MAKTEQKCFLPKTVRHTGIDGSIMYEDSRPLFEWLGVSILDITSENERFYNAILPDWLLLEGRNLKMSCAEGDCLIEQVILSRAYAICASNHFTQASLTPVIDYLPQN